MASCRSTLGTGRVTPLERDYKRVFKVCSVCGSTGKRLSCPPCGTNYCGVTCQRVAWKRGHRKECRKIAARRNGAAQHDAALREAPLEEPLVFYGPAPRSRADEARARIVAEHEAARALREATPEPQPASVRFGSRCPICLEAWDVNQDHALFTCCCRQICTPCTLKLGCDGLCPLCRMPRHSSGKEHLDRIERHANDEVPEAIQFLGSSYLQRNPKRAVRFFRRAARLGNVVALLNLGAAYETGHGAKYDPAMARECYRKVADMGHYEHKFAYYCIQEKNYEKGIPLFRSAAKQGYALAQFYVGYLFDPDPSTYGMEPTHGIAPFLRLPQAPPDASENCNAAGDFIVRDITIVNWDYEAQLAEARRWFVRASLNGYSFAKTALESKKKA